MRVFCRQYVRVLCAVGLGLLLQLVAITGQSQAVVAVTVTSHIESNDQGANSSGGFAAYLNSDLQVLGVVNRYGAKWDQQVSSTFVQAMNKYSTAQLRQRTGGVDWADYLVSQGHSFDQHEHPSFTFNNADGAKYIVDAVGSAPVEGGFLADRQTDIDEAKRGLTGVATGFFWRPNILSLGSVSNHVPCTEAPLLASGVWRPLGAGDQYLVDDPTSDLPVVGTGWTGLNGELVESTGKYAWSRQSEYIKELVAVADPNRLYTAGIHFAESKMRLKRLHSVLEDELKALKPYVDSGQVVYLTIPQVVDLWRSQYGSQANILPANTLSKQQQWYDANC